MNSIIMNLSDPGWWFTAVFMAIVASVIAGFLKDKIAEFLGNTFSGLRRWREEKKAQRDKIIEAMISNQIYFTIALFVVVLKSIFFLLLTMLYTTWPILMVNIPQSSLLVVDLDFLIWKICSPVIGILTIFNAYRTSATVSLVAEAIREFCKRNSLPRLP